MFMDHIERQQRMAQMIEDPHEQHEVEAFAQAGDVVNRHLAHVDILTGGVDDKGCLPQVMRGTVDAQLPARAASFRPRRTLRCSRYPSGCGLPDRPAAHRGSLHIFGGDNRPGNDRAQGLCAGY
ncbi:hypothetical protein [Yoonia sp.]|uniref:hypothetical protein n=1 Tax=Yoonia sp. TaxID=2212373 RepID=UPI00391A6B54